MSAKHQKGDVLILLSLLLLEYKTDGMRFRNGNGSQFISTAVRSYSKDQGITQECSYVAEPEDNLHIEVMHSNLQQEVIGRFELYSIYQAQMFIGRYYISYNEKRRHGSLTGKTPMQSTTNVLIQTLLNSKK